MFLFGWGKKTVKQIGIAFKNRCNNCHNEDFWILSKITTWFSLYLIPVLPYSTKYFLSCPICQQGLVLNQEQLRQIKPLAELNQLLASGQISESDYRGRLHLLNGPNDEPVRPAEENTKELLKDSSLNYCSNCGQKVSLQDRFCVGCGNNLTSEQMKSRLIKGEL